MFGFSVTLLHYVSWFRIAFWIPKNYERYRQDRWFMLVLNRFLGEYCRSLLRIPDGGGMWKGHHECRSFFPSRFHVYVTFSLYTTIINHSDRGSITTLWDLVP